MEIKTRKSTKKVIKANTFKTPAEFLRQLFLDRKEKNPSYSTRAFARDLNISQSLLSLIMNGKRPLSIKQAIKISLLLELDPGTKDKFIKATLKENDENFQTFNNEMHKNFDVERFKTLSQWYHLPILDLVTTVNFKDDRRWIARRLGINPIEVRDAIERLLGLGLLERDNFGHLQKTDNRIYFGTSRSEPAVRIFHKQMIQKSLDELEKTDDASFKIRQISAMTMAVSKDKIEEAKERIQKFQQELASFLGNDDCDEIYQLNIQMFPLTKEIDEVKNEK